jgi:hypothetical protein
VDDFDSGFDRKVDCVQDLPRGRDNFRSGPSNANTMKQRMPFLASKIWKSQQDTKVGTRPGTKGKPLGPFITETGLRCSDHSEPEG